MGRECRGRGRREWRESGERVRREWGEKEVEGMLDPKGGLVLKGSGLVVLGLELESIIH